MKIALRGARVVYGERVVALAGLDLDVASGEWLGLIGPSGSGKTSALRAIAGFERIAAGQIALGDRVVADGRRHTPPERRGVGFVFQEFALFPHLTVAGNVAFGLRHLPRAERARRVAEALALVELSALADRLPGALSGGQQQRVALARALAPAPSVLLMDEPFGSLDPGLRSAVRRRVVEALRASGCTVVFISHDLDEALTIADRLALLRDGERVQVDAPEALYTRPVSAFAARFPGPVDLVPGVADGARIDTALGPLTLARPAEGPRLAVVRPHMLRVVPSGAEAEVVARIYRGHEVRLTVRCGPETLHLRVPPTHRAGVGDTLHLAVPDPVETVPPDDSP